MVNVSKQKGKKDPSKEYNNVLSIMPMPKSMTLEPRVNELVDFGIDDRFNEELMSKLWPWVRKLVEESFEALEKPGVKIGEKSEEPQDDAGIPF
jgi:hypothetical protein